MLMPEFSDIISRQLIREERLFEQYLLEAELKDIYQKYYTDIPEEEFWQIVKSDPTYNPQKETKMGTYGKWLLNLKRKGLKNEDLYKANEYLSVFNKVKNKLTKKDINQYKSLPELYNSVKDFIEGNEDTRSKSEITRDIKNNGAEEVYKDDSWLVIVPKTKEAACYYGKGTQWCTAATKGNNYFDFYNNQGTLYIVIDKRNNKKYQFHLESKQYMYDDDEPIEGNIPEELGFSQGLLDFFNSKGGDWQDAMSGQQYILSDRKKQEIQNEMQHLLQIGNNVEDACELLKDINFIEDYVAWTNGNAFITEYEYANMFNSKGELMFQQWFTDFGDTNNDKTNLIYVKLPNHRYNYIKPDGSFLFKEELFMACNFKGDYARFESAKGFNYIDFDGKIMFPNVYFQFALDFNQNGFARVRYNNKDYFINENGQFYEPDIFNSQNNGLKKINPPFKIKTENKQNIFKNNTINETPMKNNELYQLINEAVKETFNNLSRYEYNKKRVEELNTYIDNFIKKRHTGWMPTSKEQLEYEKAMEEKRWRTQEIESEEKWQRKTTSSSQQSTYSNTVNRNNQPRQQNQEKPNWGDDARSVGGKNYSVQAGWNGSGVPYSTQSTRVTGPGQDFDELGRDKFWG